MTGERYPIGTAQDMARIPADAQARMLAELPAILAELPKIDEAIPIMAIKARNNLPAAVRWLFPLSAIEAGLRNQMKEKLVWVDDDKGTGTVTMRMGDADEPFYSRTVKMGPRA